MYVKKLTCKVRYVTTVYYFLLLDYVIYLQANVLEREREGEPYTLKLFYIIIERINNQLFDFIFSKINSKMRKNKNKIDRTSYCRYKFFDAFKYNHN